MREPVGATGAAGDITHVRIDTARETLCSGGNIGCLQTVASGAAPADSRCDAHRPRPSQTPNPGPHTQKGKPWPTVRPSPAP
jgi:predicted NBD/HSP70 family sugar kinase